NEGGVRTDRSSGALDAARGATGSSRMLTAREIIAALGLVPHPAEGGYFAETWRSSEALASSALPARYRGMRSAGTAIYYLLDGTSFSSMHQLATDEVFHFYLGDAVEMLLLEPAGAG